MPIFTEKFGDRSKQVLLQHLQVLMVNSTFCLVNNGWLKLSGILETEHYKL